MYNVEGRAQRFKEYEWCACETVHSIDRSLFGRKGVYGACGENTKKSLSRIALSQQ